ncbi:MAG TPA: hypothetical protein VF477_06390, partial [Mycobacterium sp.]
LHRGHGDPTIGEHSWTAHYAVGGILLTVKGSDGAVVDDPTGARKHAAAQTIARLRALKAPTWKTAPGLAGSSGDELKKLLPTAEDFPNGWDTYFDPTYDGFGITSGGGPTVQGDCALLLPDWWPANAPAATVTSSESFKLVFKTAIHDLVIGIAREFDTAIATETADRAERCARDANIAPFTVAVLEDTRHDNDVQRLRYVIAWNGDHQTEARFPTYFSVTRIAGLVVSARATAEHTAQLDGLVARTVANISHQR